MIQSPFVLPLSIVLLAVSSLLVTGQNQPRNRVSAPGLQVPSTQQAETLSTNYRVTFSGKSEEKPLGTLSTLTCSTEILLSGPLNSSDTPTNFSVTGTLEEKDGMILFSYSIGFRVPVITTSQPNQPPQPVGYRSVEYQDHSSRGTLKMKPGKIYDVLVSGGNTYSIVVAPEIEK